MTSAGPSATPAPPAPGAASPLPHPSEVTLSPALRAFPRASWPNVSFGWPDFHPSEVKLKAQWAARAASQKWAAALAEGSAQRLDEIDFAVAVFDKAWELNSYFGGARARYNCILATSDEWIAKSDIVIAYAFNMARAVVQKEWPNSHLVNTPDLDFVRTFARPALSLMWAYLHDSRGRAPLVNVAEWDSAAFTDRYLPARETLPKRPFRRLTEDEAKMDVVWLDVDYNECSPPQTPLSRARRVWSSTRM